VDYVDESGNLDEAAAHELREEARIASGPVRVDCLRDGGVLPHARVVSINVPLVGFKGCRKRSAVLLAHEVDEWLRTEKSSLFVPALVRPVQESQ
jgi:hypothetical protein